MAVFGGVVNSRSNHGARFTPAGERGVSAASTALYGRDTFHSTYSHIHSSDARDSLNVDRDFATPSSTPPSSTASLPDTPPPATPPRHKFPVSPTYPGSVKPLMDTVSMPVPPLDTTPESIVVVVPEMFIDPPSPSPLPRRRPTQNQRNDHSKSHLRAPGPTGIRRSGSNTPTTIVLEEETANMWLAAQVQFAELPSLPESSIATARASRPLSMRFPSRLSFSSKSNPNSTSTAPIKSSSLPLGPMERYERPPGSDEHEDENGSGGKRAKRGKKDRKSWRLSIGRRLSFKSGDSDGGFCVIA